MCVCVFFLCLLTSTKKKTSRDFFTFFFSFVEFRKIRLMMYRGHFFYLFFLFILGNAGNISAITVFCYYSCNSVNNNRRSFDIFTHHSLLAGITTVSIISKMFRTFWLLFEFFSTLNTNSGYNFFGVSKMFKNSTQGRHIVNSFSFSRINTSKTRCSKQNLEITDD